VVAPGNRSGCSALVEVEQSREELARSREEIQGLGEERARLNARVAELGENLEHAEGELAVTGEALHLLRTSRLMRWSGWARRSYHQVSGRMSTRR
jgi:chromosome segregation ATPase